MPVPLFPFDPRDNVESPWSVYSNFSSHAEEPIAAARSCQLVNTRPLCPQTLPQPHQEIVNLIAYFCPHPAAAPYFDCAS
jgi:hypothetical protein